MNTLLYMPDMTAIYSQIPSRYYEQDLQCGRLVFGNTSLHQAFARASTAAIRVFIPASFASMIGFVYNESIPALEFLPTFYTSHRRNNCSKPSDATVTVSSGWHVTAGQ